MNNLVSNTKSYSIINFILVIFSLFLAIGTLIWVSLASINDKSSYVAGTIFSKFSLFWLASTIVAIGILIVSSMALKNLEIFAKNSKTLMSKQGKWITLKLLAGFSIIPSFSIFIFIFVFPYFLWVYWSTYNKLKQPEILAEIEASGFGYIKNWN